MNNEPFRYFIIKHFQNKKIERVFFCNPQGLMKIKSNFNHLKFHKQKFAKVLKKMVQYICQE